MSVYVRCRKCDTTYPTHFEYCPRCSEVAPPQQTEKKK